MLPQSLAAVKTGLKTPEEQPAMEILASKGE
jgi:hypothetical protein